MRPNRGFFSWILQGRKWLLVAGILALATVASAAIIPNLFPFLDPTGLISSYNANGPIDEGTSNVFFQSLGSNGRSCGTCHLASDGFGLASRAFGRSLPLHTGTTRYLHRLMARIARLAHPTTAPRTVCC